MIFKDKTDYTSDAFNIGFNALVDCRLTITGNGPVSIEQLGEDNLWRAFPETTFHGPGAYIVSLRGAPTRIIIDGNTTVEFDECSSTARSITQPINAYMGGGAVAEANIVHTLGSSLTDVMSQDAVSKELGLKVNSSDLAGLLTAPTANNLSYEYSSLFSLIQDKSTFIDGSLYSTLSFYNGTASGGSRYKWKADAAKSTANGGTIVDPDTIGTLSPLPNKVELESYLSQQGTGIGLGCLVSLDKRLTVELFGGLPNLPQLDVTECFKKVFNTIEAPTIELQEGVYYVKSNQAKSPAINLPNNSVLRGAGMFKTTIKNMDQAAKNSIPLGSYGKQYVTILDLGVDGNRARSSKAFDILGEGMDFDSNVKNLTVKNVYIRETLGEGIDIDSCTDLHIDNLLVRNTGGNGLHISDPFPPRYCNISNVTLENCSLARGASGDSRAAGAVFRASNLNISNLIIRNCFKGILQNGEGISSSKKEPTNITNLHISGSVEEDIWASYNSSGLNISNFVISRASTNLHPSSIQIKSGDSFTLNNGKLKTKADIKITSVLEGLTINAVIASSSSLKLYSLTGFAVGQSHFAHINLTSDVRKGAITGNIVSGNITSDTASGSLQSQLIISGNTTVSISANLKNNPRVVVGHNVEE